ncbi:MAG TPA: N-6 DNA methylase [archaeon]|nr:N-6 DNA methylase [archaeon]
MNFTTVQSEGSLISADLLAGIYSGEALGQRSSDFGLNGKIRLIDEIAACWSDARAYWEALQHGLKRIHAEESGASVTREQWIIPLLRSLGFEGITFSRTAAQVGGQSYFISHRLGSGDQGLPIHIEGARNDLDKRPPTGRPRISPHALVQEYLNRTEHLWAIVTNGLKFRILRDAARMSRPVYLEFDLKQMMEGEQFAEFQLFYRLVHRSRWPDDLESAHECLLEKYFQQGIEAGGRVRERLRDGIEKALKIFGNGFLSHPDNDNLRGQISSGKLAAADYYRQLLRLIYRFLFLMVSEDRNLVGPDPENDLLRDIYSRFYNISRLRGAVERPVNPEERHWDLWEGVKQTFRLYCFGIEAEKLGVTPLNGDLFGPSAIPDLEEASLYNKDFLRGFAHLSLFKDEKVTRRINYAYLDVEELGSVYESLLDYTPVTREENGSLKFDLAFGTERKSTGSYYTRPELVQELIKSALVPVLEERLEAAQNREQKVKALLNLKVCDPASGSGHFLLAASRRIGRELARVRTGEEQPTPTEFRRAVREVIRHCIYGVDLNPLAVDLCKLSLWIEGHNRGLPLTFLDHRIKCGNSLVGLDSMERLKEGIPDEAFNPLTGDDKVVSKEIKARNRKERREWEEKRQQQMLGLEFIDERLDHDLEAFARQAQRVDSLAEDSAKEVESKQQAYEKIRTDSAWHRDWTAANIWTAAFFYPLKETNDPAIPTHERLMRYLERPGAADGRLVGGAFSMAVKHHFFHWPLEFPDTAEAGGFDVVLGNPPWERIKLQEQEFFAEKSPEIANAPNAFARRRMIQVLEHENQNLYSDYREALRSSECESQFLRKSDRYPLTGKGDINTYAVFAEHAKCMISGTGRVGIIVPSGIATDDTTKEYFQEIIENKNLVSLYDFENREGIFPGVHRSYKFCLLTLTGVQAPSSKADFSFFSTNIDHLGEDQRHFTLTDEEIAKINPNTRTCPIFRSKRDAEITKRIYERCPVLWDETKGEEGNPWGIRFLRMLDMSNDSHLFRTREELGVKGFQLAEDNSFVKGDERYLRLYEAKMIWHFDHRFGTYEGYDETRSSTHLPTPTQEQYADPNFVVLPRYWIDAKEVLTRNKIFSDYKWIVSYRRITNATNERTAVFTFAPYAGFGDVCPVVFLNTTPIYQTLFVANMNSFIADYIARQKIGGTHLDFHQAKQCVALTPSSFNDLISEKIRNNVLELSYNSYDLEPFALDCGYTGLPFVWNEERRAQLRAGLDAIYFHLYGISREDTEYIMETFPIVKRKDIGKYGEYRTKRMILEYYDQYEREI